MSLSSRIKTPYEQLPVALKKALVDLYAAEEKFDIIEMYLHSLNTEDLLTRAKALNHGTAEES